MPEALLNETVYRILYASAKTGVLNGTSVNNSGGFILKNVTNPEHKMIARELAEESMVLLSNRDNTLPLNLSETKSILMIGQHDQAMNPITAGGGSGSVVASWVVEPVNEIAKRLGITPFQSNDNEVQRHCDASDSKCVVYAGGGCHSPSCIPEHFDYDTTIIFLGYESTEGADRKQDQMYWDEKYQRMIKDFSRQKDKKTIVVVSAPGDSVVPWENQVGA